MALRMGARGRAPVDIANVSPGLYVPAVPNICQRKITVRGTGVGERWSLERFDLEAADRRVARHQPQPGRPRPVSKLRGRTRVRA